MPTPSSDRAERKNRIALQTVGAVIAFGAVASAIYGYACANPSRTDSLL
jgi:hypothetical protein